MTIEDLQACDPEGTGTRTDAHAAVARKLEKLNFDHVRALFATRKLAWSTSLIMLVWALIGKFTRPGTINYRAPPLSLPQVLASPSTTPSSHTSRPHAAPSSTTARRTSRTATRSSSPSSASPARCSAACWSRSRGSAVRARWPCRRSPRASSCTPRPPRPLPTACWAGTARITSSATSCMQCSTPTLLRCSRQKTVALVMR